MATPLLMSEFLDRFGKHAATSEAMAGKTNMGVIPQYGFQTGYDFQKNFPGLNPKISSGLAAGYQTLQEGARALLDGPGGVTLKDAFDTAKKQAAENIEGILAADSGNITAKQLANRNAYLANQGFLNNEEGIVNTAGNRINDFLNNLFFTTAYAPEVTEDERKSIERQPPSFRSLNDPEVYGELENKGIMSQFNPLNLLGFLTNIYTGGLSDALTTSGATKLFSNLLEAGKNTPNYQFVNPNKPNFNRIASDFYDPKTGLDRFDRAKTLFGQSRTLAEFLDKRREQKIRELDLAEKRRLASRIPSGGDSDAGYSPGQDAGMGFGGGRTDPTDKS